MNQRKEAFAIGRNRRPIFYEVEGNRGPVAFMLCDGVGCSGFIWKYLKNELAELGQVAHFHYPGHGRTPAHRNYKSLGITDLALDLAGVMDSVDPTARWILLGHSMGVQVCLEAYRSFPERVAGLILACGSYGSPLKTFKGTNLLEQVLPYGRLLMRGAPQVTELLWSLLVPSDFAYQVATQFEINPDLIKKEDFLPYLEHLAQMDARLFVEMVLAADRHSAEDVLPKISVPTLIVAGERDGFTPLFLSEKMHRAVKQSELYTIPSGSHAALLERPTETNQRIQQFLADHFLNQRSSNVSVGSHP